jgi:acyl-CoA synthetase (NDP forming)
LPRLQGDGFPSFDEIQKIKNDPDLVEPITPAAVYLAFRKFRDREVVEDLWCDEDDEEWNS